MSIPENSAAQETGNNQPPEFEQQVNEAVGKLVEGADGNWHLPDDLDVSEEVRYAAKLEKRRRDTQSALSKTRQESAASKALIDKLEQRVAEQVKIDLTPEESADLETLKFEDPDAWRVKVNQLEQKATTTIREEFTAMSTEASQQAELARREQVLVEFNQAHSDMPITNEVIDSDIPPRITKKLAGGLITFEEFLNEAHNYLTTPKKVVAGHTKAEPSLGDVGGAESPSKEARTKVFEDSYTNETY